MCIILCILFPSSYIYIVYINGVDTYTHIFMYVYICMPIYIC